MENKEWHLFGSEMVCRTSVHHTRIKYQTKIGLPQLEDSSPVKYLALLAMATQKVKILFQFGSRVVAVNSPRLSLLSAAQIPHLLNRLHDMVIDTPSAFNCTWVPLRLGWNVWTWLICECPGNYSHQAPWPRSETWWVEPGLRFVAAPLLKYGGGVTNVFTRGPLAYTRIFLFTTRPVGAQPTIQDSLRQTQSFDCPGCHPHIEDIKFWAPPLHDGIEPSTQLKEVFRIFHILRSTMVRFHGWLISGWIIFLRTSHSIL